MLAGAVAAVVVIARLSGALSPAPNEALVAPPVTTPAPAPLPAVAPPVDLAGAAPPTVAAAAAISIPDCAVGPAQAAAANAASLRSLVWAPFGRSEIGWEVYVPRIAAEIGAACAPETPGFAAALAAWQTAHKLAPSGVIDPPTFNAMNTGWALGRPFVVASQKACPPPPPEGQLVSLGPSDIYGKPERLLPDALAAYRRMVADARAAVPAIAADKTMLTVFSAYRDPAADTARCTRENNCGGPVRTTCSAHRTGRTVDLVVGHAPGQRPDSSDDANRLAMSKTPAYLWLVANAGRYGFLNYAFEPWHWEWSPPPGERAH